MPSGSFEDLSPVPSPAMVAAASETLALLPYSAGSTHLNALFLSNPFKHPDGGGGDPRIRRRRSSRSPPPFSSTTLSAQHPSSPSPSVSLLPVHRAAAGALAGAIAGAFTYVSLLPIDAVKTRLQTKGAAQIYSGAADAALHILRSEGPLGFYRGVSAVVLGSAASSAFYFGTCELAKSILSGLHGFPSFFVPPAAGAMGNVVSSAIMVPKELITQRMQTGATGRSWEVLAGIIQRDGISGLYTGYSATLLRNLPAGVLSFSSFEYLKGFVLGMTGQKHLEPLQSICCGALAGAISASLTTPLDVVKTRLMTQAGGEAGRGVAEATRRIVAEEGWLGLTSGMGPRVLHSALFAALGYSAFETVRLALIHRLVRRSEAAMACDKHVEGRAHGTRIDEAYK